MCEVSIFCITYNQRDYLAKALDSFLMQKTDFNYEILVHDDASTDGTTQILEEYAARYPNKIHPFYEKQNQYSIGGDFGTPILCGVAKGKYIAFCEGDDYWIDEYKIQKQWEALEIHKECDMCACWGCTITEDGEREISQIRPKVGDGILTPEEVILGGGQYLVSAGLFYRRQNCLSPMDFERVIGLDYAMQIRGSLRGGIYYIDQKMAVYRRYAKGSWTNNVLKNKERLEHQWEKERELLRVLDEETGGQYHEAIEERLLAYTTFDRQLADHRDEILELFRGFHGKVFMWGLGRRGEGLEEFCTKEELHIDGVCDLTNEHVGEISAYGNMVYHTDDVLDKADIILATNSFAYNDLMNGSYKGRVVNMQEYMPLG